MSESSMTTSEKTGEKAREKGGLAATLHLQGRVSDDDDKFVIEEDSDSEDILTNREQRQNSARQASSARPATSHQQSQEYLLREVKYLSLLRTFIEDGLTRKQALARLARSKEDYGSDFELVAAAEKENEKARIRKQYGGKHSDDSGNDADDEKPIFTDEELRRLSGFNVSNTRQLHGKNDYQMMYDRYMNASGGYSDEDQELEAHQRREPLPDSIRDAENADVIQEAEDRSETREGGVPSGLRGGSGDEHGDLNRSFTDLQLSASPDKMEEDSQLSRTEKYKKRRELYWRLLEKYQADYGYPRDDAIEALHREDVCGSDWGSIAASEAEEYQINPVDFYRRDSMRSDFEDDDYSPNIDVGHATDANDGGDGGQDQGHSSGGGSSSLLHPDRGRSDNAFLDGKHEDAKASMPKSQTSEDAEMTEDTEDNTRR